MQVMFAAFLIAYAILIVTRFYHYPFLNDGIGYEIFVLLYVTGIAFEELLQVDLLFCY